MVLGFLAFGVWIGTQAEFWNHFVPPKLNKNNTPNDWHQLLHVVEDVHMHLFISMLLHFLVVAQVVYNTAYIQHVLENMEVFHSAASAENAGNRWKGFPHMEAITSGYHSRGMTLESRRIPKWLAGLPDENTEGRAYWPMMIYQQLFMRMTRTPMQDVLNVCRSFFIHHCDKHVDFEIGNIKTDYFDFALYIRVSLDEMLTQLIHFSRWSWLVCLTYYAVICILSEYLPESDDNVEFIMMGFASFLAVAFIPMFYWVNRRLHWMLTEFGGRMGKLRESGSTAESRDNTSEDTDNIQMRPVGVNYETAIRMVCQATTFLNCYSLARVFGAKRYYDGAMYSDGKQWMLGFYIAAYVVNGFMLMPRALPWMTLIFSLPPYMNQEDMERFKRLQVHRRDHPFTPEHGRALLQRRSASYMEKMSSHSAELKEFVAMLQKEKEEEKAEEEASMASIFT